MKQGNRNIVKRLRFLDLQAEQLEQLLEWKGISFTDLVHMLIAHEYATSQPYVPRESELQNSVVRAKNVATKVSRVATSYCKLDPEFLRELGRIGNNINQIAKSLNILCLSQQKQKMDFSYIQCLAVLENIQQQLHQHLDPLPIITRSEYQVERRKEQALRYVTTQREDA